jgi:hypothetical protein
VVFELFLFVFFLFSVVEFEVLIADPVDPNSSCFQAFYVVDLIVEIWCQT